MGFGGTIRKVAIATATVTTVAGATQQIGSADGTGAAARFNWPGGIATDGAGNLFVADTSNGIRPEGRHRDRGGHHAGGGGGGFYEPSAIATDGAGNVYVSDGGRLIRKVVVATGAVTTLAGAPDDPYPGYADGVGTAARFSGAGRHRQRRGGNLYVADANNNCIRKVVIATGAVTTFAGAKGQSVVADGTGAAARFSAPYGIASDGAGNLFVADSNTIRKVVIATGAVTTLAGAADQPAAPTGRARPPASPTHPASPATERAMLYVAEPHNTVRKVAVEAGTCRPSSGPPTASGYPSERCRRRSTASVASSSCPRESSRSSTTAENAVLIGHL